MSNKVTIGAVSKQTGLRSKTIRFYEGKGPLPPPRRGESGYRPYSDADVMRLQFVSRLRLLGLNLPKIRDLVSKALSESCASFSDEPRGVIARQQAEVDSRLRQLTVLRDELSGL